MCDMCVIEADTCEEPEATEQVGALAPRRQPSPFASLTSPGDFSSNINSNSSKLKMKSQSHLEDDNLELVAAILF